MTCRRGPSLTAHRDVLAHWREPSRPPNHVPSHHDDSAATAELHEVDLLIGGAADRCCNPIGPAPPPPPRGSAQHRLAAASRSTVPRVSPVRCALGTSKPLLVMLPAPPRTVRAT